MIKTFQINTIFSELIEKLKGKVSDKGTSYPDFITSQKWFNNLTTARKRRLITEIVNSQSRYIKEQMEQRKDVGLEGLGRIVYVPRREEFFTEVNKECKERGYDKLRELPIEERHEVINNVSKVLDKKVLANYFEKVRINNLTKKPAETLGILITVKPKIVDSNE